MHIMVFPVSGNFFPVQLGLLSRLIDSGYDADMLMGTSGGAVCSVLALGSDWSVNGIRRLAKELKPSLFLKNWWPDTLSFMPSWMLGFFRGSVYNSGKDAYDYFEKHFTPESLTQKEMWIGVTNQTQERSQIFCNLKHSQSFIDTKHFDSHLKIGQNTLCEHLRFLGGDMEVICDSCVASASIPTLVPAKQIGEDLYVDGGVFFASPMTPMKDCLEELEDENGLHITYVNTYDLEEQDISTSVDFYPGIFRTGALAFATMVYSILSQDRLNGLKMLDPDIGRLHRITLKGSPLILKQIHEFRGSCKRTFLELFTKEVNVIDLTNFTGDDVLRMMDTTEKEYYCRLWWIGDSEFKIKI